MTPLLFHGPEARDRGLQKALEVGRMVGDPIGDSGLKVADSRAIVQLALSPGVGDRPPCVLVGPLDSATPEAADALLKTLEEISVYPLRIILWTDFLGGVIPTIRSRTLHIWCPPSATWLDPLSYMDEPAKKLKEAMASKNWAKVITLVRESAKDWPDLLTAYCSMLDPLSDALLWERVRPALSGRGSYLVALDALLPEWGKQQ